MLSVLAILLCMPVCAARADVAVCFEPGGPCEEQIVAAISAAKSQIRMQAYSFTARPIAAALIDAKTRGVDVQILLDRSNEIQRNSQGRAMVGAGIPVWIDYLPAIAHGKDIIIDGRLVVGGSYNYTGSASRRNAENVLFIADEAVARRFLEHWAERQALSRLWSGDAERRTTTGLPVGVVVN